MYIILKDKYT